MKWLAIVGTFVLIYFRIFMFPGTGELQRDDIFKDIAHLWVGGLFGAWIFGEVAAYWIRKTECFPVPLEDTTSRIERSMWRCGALAVLLTIVEVVAFFLEKQ